MPQQTLLRLLQSSGLLPPQCISTVSLKALTGGFWNQVLRLRSEYQPPLDWVVKVFVQGPANPLFPILAQAEYAALQFLHGHACAPRPVGFIAESPLGSILVYEYVQGSAWNCDLDAAARLLARVHRIPVDAGASKVFRNLPTEGADLLDHAEQMLRRHDTTLSDSVRAARPDVHGHRAIPVCPECLVHTDCGPGNMVSSPDGLRLIDWQCPGIGDGLQDVVTFLSPAMQVLYGYAVLTPMQERQFLETYFAAMHEDPGVAQDSRKRLDLLRSSHHFRFAAYCAMRAQDTAQSDEKTAQLYRRALLAEMQLLQHPMPRAQAT
jgi:aminoglycoside phosphotransferase (APT) family kinase protein